MMPGRDRGDGPIGYRGPIVGAVVGDHAHDPGDAVRGEERPGPVEEPDRGLCGLVEEVGRSLSRGLLGGKRNDVH